MAWVISRDDASSTTVAPRSRSRREKMLRRGSRTSRAKNATTPRKNGGRTAVAAGVAGSERDARDGSCPGREEEANGDEGSDCERDPGGWFGGGEGAVFGGRLPGTSDANADADATFFARSRGEASRAAVTIAASRRYGSSSGFPSGARVRATPSSPSKSSRRNAARRSRSFRAISSREASSPSPPRRKCCDSRGGAELAGCDCVGGGRKLALGGCDAAAEAETSDPTSSPRRTSGGRSRWRVFCVSLISDRAAMRRLRRRGGDPARDG